MINSGNVNVYHFADGENHWIAAADENQAREFFEQVYYGCEPDEYTCEKVSEADLSKKTVLDTEGPKEKSPVSLKSILESTQGLQFPRVLATSVY